MKMMKLIGVVAVVMTLLTCTKGLDPVSAGCSLFISEEDEVAMGDSLNSQIRRSSKYKVYQNTTKATNLTNYVKSIGDLVVATQDDRRPNTLLQYRFAVLEDTSVNAFATPGGYVFINTGLIKACRNEAELAGVIAHEIAHITNEHSIESLCKSSIAGFITSAILGDSSVIGQMLDGLLFMNFISQPNELEADSCAVQYMAACGYNPNGMKTFFEFLNTKGNIAFEVLSSHPTPEHRIVQATRVIKNMTAFCQTDSCLFQSRLDVQRANLP